MGKNKHFINYVSFHKNKVYFGKSGTTSKIANNILFFTLLYLGWNKAWYTGGCFLNFQSVINMFSHLEKFEQLQCPLLSLLLLNHTSQKKLNEYSDLECLILVGEFHWVISISQSCVCTQLWIWQTLRTCWQILSRVSQKDEELSKLRREVTDLFFIIFILFSMM